MPLIVEDFDCHAEPSTGDLTAAHRAHRISEYEARNDVRAAADARNAHVLLDSPIHEVEALVT
jgi:hypothetical protein